MTSRNGTKTRSFGVGIRENHDASPYYERQLMPPDVWSDLDPHPLDESPIPQYAKNRINANGIDGLAELPDRCVHLILAAPTINVGSSPDFEPSLDQHLGLFERMMHEAYRVLVDGGRACIMVSNANLSPYLPLHLQVIDIAAQAGLYMRGEIIWDELEPGSSLRNGVTWPKKLETPNETHGYVLVFQKPPFGRKRPNGRNETINREDFLEHTKSFWRIPQSSLPVFDNRPELFAELARRLIHLYTYSDEVVLDPYAFGHAIESAVRDNGRIFVGFRLAPDRNNSTESAKFEFQFTKHPSTKTAAPRADKVGQDVEDSNEIPSGARNEIFLNSSETMIQLPDRCVDLMFTSPPYNVGKEYDDSLTMEEYLGLLYRVLNETYRVLVAGGWTGINVANIGRKPYIPLHSYVAAIALDIGFHMAGEVIWEKGMSGASTAWGSWMSPANPTLRDTHEYILLFQKPKNDLRIVEDSGTTSNSALKSKTHSSVWRISPASAKHAKHPAPFPSELPGRMIDLYSTVGDTILDPFMGTGATALAADERERQFVGYEINPDYVGSAYDRINENRKAQRFVRIAREHFALVGPSPTRSSLTSYIERCFDDAIEQLGLTRLWICKLCTLDDNPQYGQGEKPKSCPRCHEDRVYYVGDFQTRASAVGSTFRAAVQVLFQRAYGIELVQTAPGVRTHNLQASSTIAIEAKGSPTEFGRPGMKRSDTRKKSHDNARRYKSANPNGLFYVVSNSFLENHEESDSIDVDGYFDVTDPDQMIDLKSQIERLVR